MSEVWSCQSRIWSDESCKYGFYTQSTRSFSEYLSKLKSVVDFVRRTSVREMAELPNQYLHGYYKKMFDAMNDPEKMKQMQGAAMMDEMEELT